MITLPQLHGCRHWCCLYLMSSTNPLKNKATKVFVCSHLQHTFRQRKVYYTRTTTFPQRYLLVENHCQVSLSRDRSLSLSLSLSLALRLRLYAQHTAPGDTALRRLRCGLQSSSCRKVGRFRNAWTVFLMSNFATSPQPADLPRLPAPPPGANQQGEPVAVLARDCVPPPGKQRRALCVSQRIFSGNFEQARDEVSVTAA